MASVLSGADNVPLIWPKFKSLILRALYIERGQQVCNPLETLRSARFSLGLKSMFSRSQFQTIGLQRDLDHRWSVASSDRRVLQNIITFIDTCIDDV